MSKILKNNSGSDIFINDTGINITNGNQYIIPSSEYPLWGGSDDVITYIGNGNLVVNNGSQDLSKSQGIDLIKGYLSNSISIAGTRVEESRLMITDNRIPPGYSLYVCGVCDNISNGTYGNGNFLKFDSNTSEIDFELLNHYYIIGARAIWQDCDINNYFNGILYAPATTGLVNQTGNFNKVSLGGGNNLIKPVTAGQGSWDMDLTSKFTNTNILKATPVPSAGNVGWFDYDSETNIITPNLNQEGGYNLYDFDVNLHAFGRYVWGRKLSGSASELDVSGLIGKKIYNSWKIKFNFELDGGLLSSEKAAIVLILGVKGNI